jgi:uncharacterized protein YwgA
MIKDTIVVVYGFNQGFKFYGPYTYGHAQDIMHELSYHGRNCELVRLIDYEKELQERIKSGLYD